MPPAFAAMSLMSDSKAQGSASSMSFNPLSLLSPHSLYQQQQAQQQQHQQHHHQQQQQRDFSDSLTLSFPGASALRSPWPSTSTAPSSASQTRPSSAHHIANLALAQSQAAAAASDSNPYSGLFHPSLNSPSNTRPNTQPPQPSAWLNQQMAAALRGLPGEEEGGTGRGRT